MMHKHHRGGVVPGATTSTDRYHEALVSSLILYAEVEPEFTAVLNHLLRDIDHPHVGGASLVPARTLMPPSVRRARRRTEWILEKQSEPAIAPAIALLAAWRDAREFDEPKAIALGLDLGVLPVGIWGKMKMESEMPLIIRTDLAVRGENRLVGDSAVLATDVIAQGLRMANHNVRRLEPELADWLYGPKRCVIYRASATQLENAVRAVAELGVPHAVSTDEDGIKALALSPAVQSGVIEVEWGIERIDS